MSNGAEISKSGMEIALSERDLIICIEKFFFFFCKTTKKYVKWCGYIKKWCRNSTV